MLERFGFSFSIIGLLVFWGLAFQKKIFNSLFWKIFFFFDILLFILCIFSSTRYNLPLLWLVIMYFIGLSIHLIYYIGMFIYAFCSKQIWETYEHKSKKEYMDYPYHFKWQRKQIFYKQLLKHFSLYGGLVLIILSLTLIPIVIYNNRIIYPEGNSPEHFKNMLQYRRTNIPELKEFEQLFPKYRLEFYHKTNPPDNTVKWELVAGIYKRYLFVMQVDIVYAEVDPKTGEVITHGSHEEPTFSLWEVSPISTPYVIFGRRWAYSPHRKQIKSFDVTEWNRLVEADGDFEALGIQLKKDAPVKDFELAYSNNY